MKLLGLPSKFLAKATCPDNVKSKFIGVEIVGDVGGGGGGGGRGEEENGETRKLRGFLLLPSERLEQAI